MEKQTDDSFRYDRNKLKTEEIQLMITVNLMVDPNEFRMYINSLDSSGKGHFLKSAALTKNVQIAPLHLTDERLLDSYCRRIYQIRNSVIHTKRRPQGKMIPAILPFSLEEGFLEEEVDLLKFCAQRVILKEINQFRNLKMGFSPYEIITFLHMVAENKNYQTFIKNLVWQMENIDSKMKGTDLYPYLDMIVLLWLDMFDKIRLEEPEQLEPLRIELEKQDFSELKQAARCSLSCLLHILRNEPAEFYGMLEQVPSRQSRAYLSILSNSVFYALNQNKKAPHDGTTSDNFA